MIPEDAAIGNADIYVNAFSDWPSNGGIALTSESAITQYVSNDSSSTATTGGYQGNVGSEGQTGSYTLEEALAIQASQPTLDNVILFVSTSSSNYTTGDTIQISGTTSTIIGDTQVTLQLFKDGNLVEIAQVAVSADGNYSHTLIAEGPQWSNQGSYIVKSIYGEGNITDAKFTFTPMLSNLPVVENNSSV